jgi:hypothetical protein
LLQQPLIDKYLQTHPILNRKSWQKVNHPLGSCLRLASNLKFVF